MRHLILAILSIFLFSTTADAWVLCAKKDRRTGSYREGTAVKLRNICRNSEVEVDPAEIGIQGAQGVPGDPGEQGPQGDAGAQGDDGLPGQDSPPMGYIVDAAGTVVGPNLGFSLGGLCLAVGVEIGGVVGSLEVCAQPVGLTSLGNIYFTEPGCRGDAYFPEVMVSSPLVFAGLHTQTNTLYLPETGTLMDGISTRSELRRDACTDLSDTWDNLLLGRSRPFGPFVPPFRVELR